MKRNRLVAALVAALLLCVVAYAQQQPPANATSTLKAGDTAPDFTLVDQNRNKVTLSEFRGKKNVVLAFYVLAFTGG
jgi:cytochrome oxidase Cu insertion factor (SCO1/SenC/PrrC family)